MSAEPTATDESERRALLLTMVACAVVVVVAVVVAVVFGAAPEEGKGKVLKLAVAEAEQTEPCGQPTEASLKGSEYAFSATVLEVEEDEVVLETHHWFAGEPAEEVVIETTRYGYLHDLPLVEDDRYLIASAGEEIQPCSGSGEENHARVIAFDEAFNTD